MRLIDIEAEVCTDCVFRDKCDRQAYCFAKEMQTVDAVEVVRCMDCKHCDPENYHCDHPMGTAAPLRRKPDDFCSYGERKESADND